MGKEICLLRVTGRDIRPLARKLMELEIGFCYEGCEVVIGKREGGLIVPYTSEEKFRSFLERRGLQLKIRIDEI